MIAINFAHFWSKVNSFPIISCNIMSDVSLCKSYKVQGFNIILLGLGIFITKHSKIDNDNNQNFKLNY